MTVHNLMEDIVRAVLKELIQTQEHMAGLDEESQEDVIALALNHLPPKYVSTAKGEIIAKTQLRAQVETDILRELSVAAAKVLQSPRK